MNDKKLKKICGCWYCRGNKVKIIRDRVAKREFRQAKLLGLAALGLLLTSCATTRPGQTVPEQPRHPPADAVQLCPGLADVELGQGGLADLARALQTTADRYQECRSRHAELVEWTQKT